MPVDPTIRFKHWAAALGSASLLAGASLAAAAELCAPIRQSGDFAAKLQKVDKGFSRADDICYADGVRWSERAPKGSGNIELAQRFDYFRPTSADLSQKLPLVIWAHPSGETENMPLPGPRFQKQVIPALEKNFAFMSIEFRHPVSSQLAPTNPPTPPQLDIPNTDITHAVQWVRAWADELGIDPKNIFLMGQSRGTLSLLTALSPNMATSDGAPYMTQSSRVSAAWAVQAQTTYRKGQVRDTFIHPDDHKKFSNSYAEFIKPGSAIDQISVNDPPLALRYEHAPTDPELKTVIPLHMPNDDKTCSYADGCFDLHHPNFGLKLKLAFDAAYTSAGQKPPASKFDIGYNVPPEYYFADQLTGRPYICFFVKHLTPAALTSQTTAALASCGL